MFIFSGTSNPSLARKIAKNLNTKLSKMEIFRFPDKEVRIRVLENVVDKRAIVVQSTGVHPNHYYMQLFFILDALKRSGGTSIDLVIPYLGYQRQDHIFRSGEAVSLEVIVNLLKTMRVDRIISFDLHALRIVESIKGKGIKISHLSALPLFAKQIEKMGTEDLVLVAPDMGGIRRIKQISEMLQSKVGYVTIEKNRDLNSGEVESSKVTGDVKKRAVIIDDMISTGKTLIAAAHLLKEKGAEEIYVMATHGIFAGDAPQALEESIIKKVTVTDTIEVRPKRRFEKLEILSVANLIAEELRATSR